MKKYTFKEIAPENCDFSFYFDDDTFTENAGGFEYNLFIVSYDRGREYGFNIDRYKDIKKELEYIIDDPDETDDEKIKAWAAGKDRADVETIAEYLSLKTGREWKTAAERGYCQGDYCDILYCTDIYKPETVGVTGQIFLGCGKEFSFTDDGETVYGYIVADNEYRDDNELKKILCGFEGVNPDETELLLIDSWKTQTIYNYKGV